MGAASPLNIPESARETGKRTATRSMGESAAFGPRNTRLDASYASLSASFCGGS